jgi:hypothetical protein
VAFESNRAGEQTQLFVMPVDGGEPAPWEIDRFQRNQVFDDGVTLGTPPPEGAGPN